MTTDRHKPSTHDRMPDGRKRRDPDVRMEHCDGCAEMTASTAIRNTEGADGAWRALCPKCRQGDR